MRAFPILREFSAFGEGAGPEYVRRGEAYRRGPGG